MLVVKPPAVLSSCYWLMEALRGADFTGSQTTQKRAPGDSSREEEVRDGPLPSSPPPEASWMPERDDSEDIGRDGSFGQSYRDSSDGGDDGGLGADEGVGEEEFVRVEGRREAEEANGFFKFYPFLNDVGHNEMDGEAR